MFVAGYETLHKFIVSRLAERTDIWIAQALSARNFAKGTVYRMKPDVKIVDLDPIWNPAGLPLARSVSEACPDAHVILVAPDGYPQGPMLATAAIEPGWSVIIRRKADNGERLMQALVAGLGGGSWVDHDLKGPETDQSNEIGGTGTSGTGRNWADGLEDGDSDNDVPRGSGARGLVDNAEIEEWKKRARNGMG